MACADQRVAAGGEGLLRGGRFELGPAAGRQSPGVEPSPLLIAMKMKRSAGGRSPERVLTVPSMLTEIGAGARRGSAVGAMPPSKRMKRLPRWTSSASAAAAKRKQASASAAAIAPRFPLRAMRPG